MYKVGICGHLGLGKDFADGQTDKTRAVYKALVKALGEERVTVLDTCGWKSNPVAMFFNCRKLLKSCENVIMMPSRNGFKVFPRVFELLNFGLGRKLHYVVVGGWLADRLEADSSLIPSISKLDRVYVELEPMREALHRLGVKNAVYMPNLRETHSIAENELVYSETEPYKLCTFSRIMLEKGIEDAVQAVRAVNSKYGRTVFSLDIYGKIDPDYTQRFNELCESFEPFINYRGYIESDRSTDELKAYFALLFPTVCEGEGFAGTIVDAFAAGIPVIATDWHYNSHIIRNGVDGLIYPPLKRGELERILLEAAENPQRLNLMKKACLERAEHFEADKAVEILLNELE